MPSSYTPSLRLEQQFTGENVNTWGVLLNEVFARTDASIAGLKTIALTGNRTLTTANGTDDEARNAIIKTTGTGAFVVTVPSVSKMYAWWNACTGNVTVTTGSGTTVEVAPGETVLIMCDAANVKRLFSQSMGGARLTNVGAPAASTDAATKGYVDGLAFEAASGQLPGQVGSDGRFLTTNANTAGWAFPTVSSISDYETDQAIRTAIINANTNAVANSVTAMGVRVSPLEQGYEAIQSLTIANSGTLTVDLAGPNTAFRVTLNRNISNVAYINAPPVGTRKTWTLTVVGNATANTVTWTANTAAWPGGTVSHSGGTPTINTANGVHNTFTQWTEDGGTKVRSNKGAET